MNTVSTGPAGYMIADPDGNVYSAARSKAAALRTAGPAAKEGTAGKKPAGTYTVYACNQDIVDYFRLRSPRSIPWDDIDFNDGVAIMRISRGRYESGKYRTINVHPHAYHRLKTLASERKITALIDKMIDYYIEGHPELFTPEAETSQPEQAQNGDELKPVAGPRGT